VDVEVVEAAHRCGLFIIPANVFRRQRSGWELEMLIGQRLGFAETGLAALLKRGGCQRLGFALGSFPEGHSGGVFLWHASIFTRKRFRVNA